MYRAETTGTVDGASRPDAGVMPVHVTPAPEAARSQDVLGMLVGASADRDLCDDTYLPFDMDADEARRWASDRKTAWVVFDDGVPVGWWEAKPLEDSCGFTLPAGTWERETWLVTEARGRRVIQRATELLLEELVSRGVTHLADIAWSDNDASIKAMQNAGFEILGQGWWGGVDDGGWCVVGVKQLEAAR